MITMQSDRPNNPMSPATAQQANKSFEPALDRKRFFSKASGRGSYGISSLTILLAMLITSYFYCLPLTRYSVLSIKTDFRIYDIMILLCLTAFVFSKDKLFSRWLMDRRRFYYWSVLLLGMVVFSLLFTFLYKSDVPKGAVFIRTYRFIGYIFTAIMITSVTKNSNSYKFLLAVFYLNIVVQSLLSWGQTFDLIPSLWPDYWLQNYDTWSKAVGTLSPHHKHISVVMLIGIVISLSYLKTLKSYVLRWLVLISLLLMLAVPFFVGARTGWLGICGIIFGYAVVHRRRGILMFAGVGLALVLVYQVLSSQVTDNLNSVFETRLLNPLRTHGFNGIAGERTVIWTDMFAHGVEKAPYILVTGTGFQNIQYFLGASGAHNNFLNVFLEIGLFGLMVYVIFLQRIYASLKYLSSLNIPLSWRLFADDGRVALIALLATMMVGETFWAQYSMFTLTGQIMTYFGIIAAPLNWRNSA